MKFDVTPISDEVLTKKKFAKLWMAACRIDSLYNQIYIFISRIFILIFMKVPEMLCVKPFMNHVLEIRRCHNKALQMGENPALANKNDF